MGGGISSEFNILNEVSRQKSLAVDGSDIVTLECAQQEIARLRHIFISDANNEQLQQCVAEENRDILITMSNHDATACDVHDLDTARNEICRIRSVCTQIHFSENQIQVLHKSRNGDNGEKIASAESPPVPVNIVSESLKEKLEGTDSAKVFKQYDKDKSGLMDKSEMRRFLRMQGIKYSEEDFTSLFNHFDVNGDGKFSYGEFVSAFTTKAETVCSHADHIITSLKSKLGAENLQFETIDRDSSGLVDKGEMRRLLRMKSIPYVEEEFDALFVRYDLNGDGKLAYDEFAAVLQEDKF
jgi:Ca2+-binding EF-hand superfamily protein